MIYLVSPYTHADPRVREERFRAACQATAELMRAGQPTLSPVMFGHLLTEYNLPGDWSFWAPFATEYLQRCDEVVVLMLDGWQESVGVQAEIRIAEANGTPVRYVAADQVLSVVNECELQGERA